MNLAGNDVYAASATLELCLLLSRRDATGPVEPATELVLILSLLLWLTSICGMPLTLEQITEEAIKLPPTARALLADKLVQSLESENLDEIQGLWSAEAIRRREEIRSGQVKPIPGDQVTEEVRRLVGR